MPKTVSNVWKSEDYGQRMQVRKRASVEADPKGLAGFLSDQVKDFVFRYDDHCFSISTHAAEAGSKYASIFKELPKRKQTAWLPKWHYTNECLSGKHPPRESGEAVKFRVGTDKSKPWLTGTVTKTTKFGVPLGISPNDQKAFDAAYKDEKFGSITRSPLADAGRSSLGDRSSSKGSRSSTKEDVTLTPSQLNSSQSAPELPPQCPLPGVTEGIGRMRTLRTCRENVPVGTHPPRTDERLLVSSAGVRQYRHFQYQNYAGPRRSAAFLTEQSPPAYDERPHTPPRTKKDCDLADFRDDAAFVIGCANDGVTLLGEHQIPIQGKYRWTVDLMALPSGGGAFVGVMEDSSTLDPAVHLTGANPFQQRVLLVRDRIQAAGVYFWRDEFDNIEYAILETVWLPKPVKPNEEPRLCELDLPQPDECLKLKPEHAKLVKNADHPKPQDAEEQKVKKCTRNPEVFDKIRAGLTKMRSLHSRSSEPEDMQLTDESRRVGRPPTKQYGSVEWEKLSESRPATADPAAPVEDDGAEDESWKQEPGVPITLTFESYSGLTVTVADVEHPTCEAIVGIRARPACGFSYGVTFRCCHAIGAPHKAGLSYQG